MNPRSSFSARSASGGVNWPDCPSKRKSRSLSSSRRPPPLSVGTPAESSGRSRRPVTRRLLRRGSLEERDDRRGQGRRAEDRVVDQAGQDRELRGRPARAIPPRVSLAAAQTIQKKGSQRDFIAFLASIQSFPFPRLTQSSELSI